MLVKPFSLLALIPFVAALTVEPLTDANSQGEVTIRWTSEPGDPEMFTIELINESFNNAFAIANNVFTSDGEWTGTLPVVPARDGYTIQLVNIGDINDVYAESSTFSIAPVSESPTSSTSSTSGASSSSSPTLTPSNTSASSTPTPTRPTTSNSQTSSDSEPSPSGFNNDNNAASGLRLNSVGAGLAAVAAAFFAL